MRKIKKNPKAKKVRKAKPEKDKKHSKKSRTKSSTAASEASSTMPSSISRQVTASNFSQLDAHIAAVKIQSRFRGFRVRKKFLLKPIKAGSKLVPNAVSYSLTQAPLGAAVVNEKAEFAAPEFIATQPSLQAAELSLPARALKAVATSESAQSAQSLDVVRQLSILPADASKTQAPPPFHSNCTILHRSGCWITNLI